MNDVDMIKDLAVHDIEIKHLQDDMDKMIKEMAEIKRCLSAIESTLSEAKGGWKTLLMVGGGVATVGGAISWVIQHIMK